MPGIITESQLAAKIEKIEGIIRKLSAKKKEYEGELKVYKKLLAESASGPVTDERGPSASDAILDYLAQVDSASAKDLGKALQGRFHTASAAPILAIYAALDALKKRGLIEPTADDPRRYRKVEEDEIEPDMQRAVG